MERKLGFDIGDVMCPDLPKRRNADGSYRLVPAFDGCLEVIMGLAQVYEPENLYIVSRSFDTVSTQANWDLLRSWDFFARTGIPESNIHIFEDAVGDWNIKGRIAAQLGLTDFVDDKRKVLNGMPHTVESLYLAVTPKTTHADLVTPTGRTCHLMAYPYYDWGMLKQLMLLPRE